jgi:hypothetical protein
MEDARSELAEGRPGMLFGRVLGRTPALHPRFRRRAISWRSVSHPQPVEPQPPVGAASQHQLGGLSGPVPDQIGHAPETAAAAYWRTGWRCRHRRSGSGLLPHMWRASCGARQNRQRRCGGGKQSDPDYGIGLTGRGTMVMPRLGSVRTNDRASRREEGLKSSDKASDNGSR